MGGCLFCVGVTQKLFLATLTPPSLSPFSYKLLSATSSSSSITTTTTTLPHGGEGYLVASCGLSKESAVSVSKKLGDPQSAILCFKAYGFTDTHIARMTEKAPWILNCRVEYTLKPKLDFLTEIGFVGQLLPDVISMDPAILKRSLQNHLMVRYRLLRPYFDSDEAFVRYVLSNTWMLSHSFKKYMKANLDLLAQEGVPRNSVGLLLSAVPNLITKSPEKFAFIFRTLKGLGIDVLSSKFASAAWSLSMSRLDESTLKKKIEFLKTTFGWSQEDFLIAVRRYPNLLCPSEEKLTNKIELFKSTLGWSQEDLSIAFKRSPSLIYLSEEKLRDKLNFYINTIKLEPQDFVTYPKLLDLSLDKRIRPRWNVLQVLKSNDLVKKDISVKAVLAISNKSFLEKYVTRHAHKIPELLGMYPGVDEEIG